MHPKLGTQPTMPLRDLTALLREDPALADLAGGSARVVAVPEAPRAFFMAGLARLTGRSPLLVGVPTTAEAERLAADLRQFLGQPGGAGVSPGSGRVELFPAWETLPFERVSPRPRPWAGACGSCGGCARRTSVPMSSWRPCGRWPSASGPMWRTSNPIIVRPGTCSTGTNWSARLVAAGLPARVPGRGAGASSPCGARSSTCTRPPPTIPSASTCGATRSTGSRPSPSPTSGPPPT